MKTPHRSMKLLALAIALGMLAAIWSVWGASLAEALNFVKTTGQFGLARGQTARINVLNTGEVRGFVVNWKFLDARGNTIVESRKPVTILPGQAASFDLAFDIFFPTEVIRVELQAMVATVIGPDVKRSLVSTLEVLNNDDGRTHRPVAVFRAMNSVISELVSKLSVTVKRKYA